MKWDMTEIRVRKLFGRFNYDFDMGDMIKSGMIILSGPNGFGKTMILECLNAISNSDLFFFLQLNFGSFEIRRNEVDKQIKIVKKNNGLCVNGEELSYKDINLSSRGIVERSSGDEEAAKQRAAKVRVILDYMQSVLGSIQYIKGQRLVDIDDSRIAVSRQGELRRYSRRILETVNKIPEEFRMQMRSLDSLYSVKSNELDRTFLKRPFELKEGIDEETFKQKIELVRGKIQKLSESGISKLGTLDVMQFREEDARALKIYFEDFDEKYRVYEKMIEQIGLFKKIVDERFLFKHLEITNGQNLAIVDDDTQERIDLNKLSSGEQEILVLYYRLLFEIPEGSIVLIDEPEISLHIAWQRKFAQDLQEIVKLRNLFAIVTTHSVQIVSGNRHIQYDLGEMYKNGLNKR